MYFLSKYNAIIEINKNYELSKELDAGFEKVDTSVRAGNNEVNVVKNTLSEMAETVGSARGAMSELMNEMYQLFRSQHQALWKAHNSY